jgi:hypothetical protein
LVTIVAKQDGLRREESVKTPEGEEAEDTQM